MNRIVPIVLVAALLVLGGVWLARQGNSAPSEAGLVEAQSEGEEAAEQEAAGETAQETEAETAEAGEGETPTASEDIDLGEFTPTPFLSETPEQNFEAPEQVLEEGKDYQALIETNKGPIRIDLFEDEVPETVNNFIFLARHHYYDGVVFHRVLEDFMAQTGDPTGTGTGGPGYQFEDEIVEGLGHAERGTVSMANAGPGTNGSQFFITFGPTPHLDGRHTVFGEVVAGDEVLDALTRIDPSGPSAVLKADEPLETLVDQGVMLEGDPETEIETYLEDKLGTLPATGQTFEVDGYTAVAGRLGEETAYGFFPQPDVMETVTILERSE